jgi:hypothetical protein
MPLRLFLRGRKWIFMIMSLLILVLVVVLVLWWRKYDSEIQAYSMTEGEELFLYGVYENEEENGIPYLVYKILPEMFPNLFPEGYDNFGFITIPRRELPLGLVKTEYDHIQWVTNNCALCHSESVRTSPDSKPIIVPGGSAGLSRQRYAAALEAAFLHYDFTPENVVHRIQERYVLTADMEQRYRKWIEHLIRRTVDHVDNIGRKRAHRPADGPGRRDALLLIKEIAYQVDWDIGTTDFPPLWQRQSRLNAKGRMVAHWDGIGRNLLGLVIGSAIADGLKPARVQMEPMKKLTYYLLNLPAPAYPLEIDRSLASRGRPVFEARCAQCHEPNGSRFNTVIPIEEIQTDASRLDAARRSLLLTLNLFDLFQRYPRPHWQKTNGYRAELLDGLWARAPYLHNGSVPTISALLHRANERPKSYFRGSNVLDPMQLGFETGSSSDEPLFFFDTSLPGNQNGGHEYGTDLSEAQKSALIEYLKTL